jgi:outer membrane translocation and assembly module TamA
LIGEYLIWADSFGRGKVFDIEAGKQALRNINGLGLFSNIEVNPRPDEKNEGRIIVEIKLKELEQKTAAVATEWSNVHILCTKCR